MTEEERAYFDGLFRQLNDKMERVLNKQSSLETDFQNTKGFLVADALVSSRRWLDLEQRVATVEEELRKRRGGE